MKNIYFKIKLKKNTKEEFLVRYNALHSKQINDECNYIHHLNPTIREFVALSKSLTKEQIDYLIMDNDRNVLFYLAMSHVLSEFAVAVQLRRSRRRYKVLIVKQP